ncbi:hypothetical protein [Winogradskyella sp.]|nr:hypothetical protein [Winogradskyella sp.]
MIGVSTLPPSHEAVIEKEASSVSRTLKVCNEVVGQVPVVVYSIV